jgi:hypothetical protein
MIRIGDTYLAAEEIRKIQIYQPGTQSQGSALEAKVTYNRHSQDNPAEDWFFGAHAELVKFFVEYILPGIGGVADVNESYESRDAVITAHNYAAKSRKERLEQMAKEATQLATGQPVMDSEGNIQMPTGGGILIQPNGKKTKQ